MQVQPYLFFEGRCEEALHFYQQAIGAQLGMVMRFKDNPGEPSTGGCASGPDMNGPDLREKVMHAAFTVGDTLLMASDGMAGGQPEFKGVSLSIAASSDEEGRRLFNALAEGGQVEMPLGETFFATTFGMVKDRFGVSWMVVVAKPM
ncbi:MAG: VOC family protein [Polaromonas sp.]|nr:VOC family protein [Polaromonas sp.]